MHLHHLLPGNAPITPKFVAIAIEESIKLGWQPESNITKFNVNYQAGKFTVSTRVEKANERSVLLGVG